MTVLTVIGLVVALIPLPVAVRICGLVIAAVPLAYDVRGLAVDVVRGVEWHALSGPRWWLLLTATVIWAYLGDNSVVVVAVAAAILAIALLVPPQKRESAPYAYGLAGLRDGPPPPSPVPMIAYPVVVALSCLLLATFVLTAANPVAVGALAVAVLVALAVASDAFLRHSFDVLRLARALRAYGPKVGIGFAGRSGGPWQLRMWEPYILRSGHRGVIYNVHEKYREMILDGDGLVSPFVQLSPHLEQDLKRLLVPGLKALFYVQNAQTNAVFMAHERITHVWLNHGDSDKPASFNPRHAHYDKLVVCGQAGVDRYEKHDIVVRPENFELLGRPQAHEIESARASIDTIAEPVVLYAPTWQGLNREVNFSSLEHGAEIVLHLISKGATVIFRPHPLSYRWRIRRETIHDIQAILELDRELTGRQHVWGEQAEKTWSIYDCSNAADALVSDVSSVVSDFLQSTKPYAMVTMRADVDDFREEFAVAQTAYVIKADLSNLPAALDDLLGADPLATARVRLKKYVLGDFEGEESADAFAAFVEALVDK